MRKSRRQVPRSTPEPDEAGRFPTIGDVFYRTRVLRGREWTLRRFAAELGVDHVMLSYVEKGQRLPGDDLARRLAEIRGEDPRELLAVLYRDRMVRALARELRAVIYGAGTETEEPAIRSFAGIISRALAALQDSGAPVAAAGWRSAILRALRDQLGRANRRDEERVLETLENKGLIDVGRRGVRKTGHYVHAAEPAERLDLAVEFAGIFAKSMTDELVRPRSRAYLQNHFLTLPKERLADFQTELDTALRSVVARFAAEGDPEEMEFFQVLVAGTTRR